MSNKCAKTTIYCGRWTFQAYTGPASEHNTTGLSYEMQKSENADCTEWEKHY